MKGLRKASAGLFLAMVLMLAMPLAVYGDAVIDEDGNIIGGGVELEGGIVTLGVELGPEDAVSAFLGFGSHTGQVVESLREGFLSVQSSANGLVHFRIDPYLTYFAHCEPELGDTVTVFYNRDLPIPMIYPPQKGAIAVVMPDGEPPYFTVGRFGQDFVSECGRYRLNIGQDTEIFLHDGQAIDFVDGVMMIGDYPVDTVRTMLVEYTVSHRDYMPNTIFPERITVLFEPIVAFPGIVPIDLYLYDVLVDLGDGPVGVAGASVATVGDSIFPNYVSLASFVRFLGQGIEWSGSRRMVTFQNPNPLFDQAVEIFIDSTDFYLNGEPMSLSVPPIIIGASTYVHLSFFREALGFSNAHFLGGIVSVDNLERME